MFNDTTATQNTDDTLIKLGITRKPVAPKRVTKPESKLIAGMINASGLENDLAQAFMVAGNAAAMMRHYLNNVGAGWKHIIVAWDMLHAEMAELDSEADADEIATYKKSIASFRTTLSAASKELFEEGLTIKDSQIVKAKTRNKASNTDPLVDFAKANANTLTDAQKAAAIEAIKALMGNDDSIAF